jgi:kynureninase
VIIDVPHAGEVVRELAARDALVDHRPGAGIRIGPHFFNTGEEIEQLVHEIKNILSAKSLDSRR